MLSSLTQTRKKAECSEEILVHNHHHSTIPIGFNALNRTPIHKGMDTMKDQETTMDKDLHEHHTWCHHDASWKLGKTHVTLFREKIQLPEDVHPSLLGHRSAMNLSLKGLTAEIGLKSSQPQRRFNENSCFHEQRGRLSKENFSRTCTTTFRHSA